jgi:signal transduction histidine kinase
MRVRGSIVLIGAFAALILVMGVGAFVAWKGAQGAQARVEALHASHFDSGVALASIRANVYLIGILTRDFLLDNDPSRAPIYEGQFRSIRSSIASDLRLLDAGAQDSGQKAVVDRLRRSVDAYWDPTALLLDWTPAQRNARREEFLRERVRRRQEITDMAAQVAQLMTQDYSREQVQIAKANEEFRRSLLWTAAVCLILGLAIGFATLVRMSALERRSEASESELRKLSIQSRTAQEQERKFLARELHDQVGQMLTGLRMELSNLARLHGDSDSEFSSRVAHAKGIVEQTLGIVRNIAMLLRPAMLDDLGLAPAVEWLAKDVSRASGIEIQTHIDADLNLLPDKYRTCLFRVTQEALTNVSRHSHALKAVVSLHTRENEVVGRIEDDGCGFPDDQRRRAGLGLIGIKERVRELGGQVRIDSRAGCGTQIELRLPVPLNGALE